MSGERQGPQPITDADEMAYMEQFIKRMRLLIAVDEKVEDLRRSESLPSSQLAADDAATNWLQLSHLVRTCLNLASDYIGALDRLLFVEDRLSMPVQAHYPLLRGIIESAAEAKWILEPEVHAERVQRSLQARITELKWDGDMFAEVIKSVEIFDGQKAEFIEAGRAQSKKRQDEIRAKLRAINDSLGLDWGVTASGMPPMVKILRIVGGVGNVPGEFTASVWRLISGLTHVSASRATHYSDVEILGQRRGNVSSARVTASMNWSHSAALVALNLHTSAVQLYRVRRVKPHGE